MFSICTSQITLSLRKLSIRIFHPKLLVRKLQIHIMSLKRKRETAQFVGTNFVIAREIAKVVDASDLKNLRLASRLWRDVCRKRFESQSVIILLEITELEKFCEEIEPSAYLPWTFFLGFEINITSHDPKFMPIISKFFTKFANSIQELGCTAQLTTSRELANLQENLSKLKVGCEVDLTLEVPLNALLHFRIPDVTQLRSVTVLRIEWEDDIQEVESPEENQHESRPLGEILMRSFSRVRELSLQLLADVETEDVAQMINFNRFEHLEKLTIDTMLDESLLIALEHATLALKHFEIEFIASTESCVRTMASVLQRQAFTLETLACTVFFDVRMDDFRMPFSMFPATMPKLKKLEIVNCVDKAPTTIAIDAIVTQDLHYAKQFPILTHLNIQTFLQRQYRFADKINDVFIPHSLPSWGPCTTMRELILTFPRRQKDHKGFRERVKLSFPNAVLKQDDDDSY